MSGDLIQFAVLGCSAICCALISPFLVLKNMTMFANSLSHTSLLGVAFAYLASVSLWGGGIWDLSTLLLGALASAILTALFTEAIHRFFRLSEDASIGLVFISFFALGVILVTLFTKNTHLSVEAVLGNPDALQLSDLQFAAPLALINLFAVTIFYRPLQLIAFDESFACAKGVNTTFWRFFLILLTSLTCIASFRAVGALVVLTLLTAPYLTARFFCNKLSHLIVLTACIALLLVAAAVALSSLCYQFVCPLSTSGILATLSALVFAACCACRKAKWA